MNKSVIIISQLKNLIKSILRSRHTTSFYKGIILKWLNKHRFKIVTINDYDNISSNTVPLVTFFWYNLEFSIFLNLIL